MATNFCSQGDNVEPRRVPERQKKRGYPIGLIFSDFISRSKQNGQQVRNISIFFFFNISKRGQKLANLTGRVRIHKLVFETKNYIALLLHVYSLNFKYSLKLFFLQNEITFK